MKKKTLLLLSCVILAGALSAAATVAYFTDSDRAVNTLVIGNVGITLDEAPVDENGRATEGGRVQENTYRLIPGHTYDKDPTVHVDEESREAWIFVRVVNEIAAIEGTPRVADQMAANGWTLVSGETDVYAYQEKVAAKADVAVFETFRIAGDRVGAAALDACRDKTVTVTAYAVQAEGFDTPAAAWTACKEQEGL